MALQNPSDAIDQDVSDADADENRPLTPREQAMERISQKHITSLEAELGHSLRPDDQLEQQLADPDPAPAPVVVEPPVVEVQKFKVKIEGVEEEVDTDTLVRNYQKNKAADRRLEEATSLLREAEALAAQPAAAAPATQQEPAQTPSDLRNQAAEVLDALYGGDRDAAVEVFTSLLSSVRGGDQPTPALAPTVDENALTDKVLARMAVNTAFATIQTDYPDLISDPDLEALTAMKIDRAVSQGVPRDRAMLTAAAEVYKVTGRVPVGRQSDPEPVPTPRVREDNKARLDNIQAASASAVPPTPAAENSNPSAVIAELSSRRLGQGPRPAS